MEMTDIRSIIIEYIHEGAAILEDELDDAIIGSTVDGRVVYDYDLIVAIFCERDGMTSDEAKEYIDYNVVQTLPLTGELSPVIIERVELYK